LVCLPNLFLYNKKTKVSIFDWDFTFEKYQVSTYNYSRVKMAFQNQIDAPNQYKSLDESPTRQT
jgi:hypothetical protein